MYILYEFRISISALTFNFFIYMVRSLPMLTFDVIINRKSYKSAFRSSFAITIIVIVGTVRTENATCALHLN